MPIKTDDVVELRQAAQAITDEGERTYALRFVNANRDLDDDAFIAKWEQDQADRLEAAAKNAHREEVVANDFLQLSPEKQREVIAMVTGVQATGSAGDAE